MIMALGFTCGDESFSEQRQVSAGLNLRQWTWFETERKRLNLTRAQLLRAMIEDAMFADEQAKKSPPKRGEL